MKVEDQFKSVKFNLQLLAGDGSEGEVLTTSTENEVEETTPVEKTFTQAELEEIISKRLARESKKIESAKEQEMQAKLKAELEESAKLAQMSETEKMKALADKKERELSEKLKALEERERALENEKILNITMKTLGEKGLPVELAQFIKTDNAEDIMESIGVFETAFNGAVQKLVDERLRSKVPTTSTVNKSAFSMDQVRGMSKEDINKNWDKIKNNLR